MKRTSKNYLNSIQSKLAIEEYHEFLMECKGGDHLCSSLLDSSLISPTNRKKYYIKVVDCGNYKQLYCYNDLKIKNDENLEKNKKISSTYLFKEKNLSRKSDLKFIEYKNISRSKFKLQRLVKANEEIFKTFITLTFKENIIDIENANRKFRYFIDTVRRKFDNFKYICVPEFQKRGAVHYHLLTNIPYDSNLFFSDEKKIWSVKHKSYTIFKTLPFWKHGFSSIYSMENINVVGYLTKYMTKDIDNRLFGRQRYLFSRNLIIPREYYIDCDNDRDFNYLLDFLNKSDVVYENTYVDLGNNEIDFLEFKLRS